VWTSNVHITYIRCMNKRKTLSAGNREFFRLLSEAAATNPFSDAYLDLQLRIAGCNRDVSMDECLQTMVASLFR
jgi:hypothetical protein